MSELTQVLRHVLPVDDPNALVGLSTGDDAAVYRLAPDRAVVVTLDFFTPVVDDPRDFGRIAAANALSDLYAMGARPLFALNVVAFPRDLLSEGILEAVVEGGAIVCRDAGIPVLGGHSIDDPEPKFGLVAVGEVDPARMVTNGGARPGDHLLLTKPLGTGVVTTALKAGAAPEGVVASAVESMAALNAPAAAAMGEVGVHAATDVSGFGFLGHLRGLLRASGVAAEVAAESVPLLPGALELAREGHIPGGTRRNLADVEEDVRWAPSVLPGLRTLLGDAQTSGGLLVAAPPERARALGEALRERDVRGWDVGRVVEGRPGTVRVAGSPGPGD